MGVRTDRADRRHTATPSSTLTTGLVACSAFFAVRPQQRRDGRPSLLRHGTWCRTACRRLAEQLVRPRRHPVTGRLRARGRPSGRPFRHDRRGAGIHRPLLGPCRLHRAVAGCRHASRTSIWLGVVPAQRCTVPCRHLSRLHFGKAIGSGAVRHHSFAHGRACSHVSPRRFLRVRSVFYRAFPNWSLRYSHSRRTAPDFDKTRRGKKTWGRRSICAWNLNQIGIRGR